MHTYTITLEELNKLARAVEFSGWWLDKREAGSDQWLEDKKDVVDAIDVVIAITKRGSK